MVLVCASLIVTLYNNIIIRWQLFQRQITTLWDANFCHNKYALLPKSEFKVAGYWLLYFYGPRQRSQKRKGQYPAAILNEEALSIMDILLYGQKENFFLQDQCGKAQTGKMSLAHFGIKLEQGFASSCPLADSAI